MAMTQQKALSKIFGDPQKKILKRLRKQVDVINGLSEKYEKLSDKEPSQRCFSSRQGARWQA